MKSEAIYIDRSKRVPVLKLNRPSKRNALNIEMWKSFITLLDDAYNDPSINVLVIKGEGDHFCAGADIEEMKNIFSDRKISSELASVTYEAQKKLHEFKKPTIAMISGSCVGGGCGIALCCDFRFADETIKIGITPGKIGLVYSLSDTKRLVDAVGFAKSKDILFTGRLIGHKESKEMGLVDNIFKRDKLEDYVFNYVDMISQTSKHSLISNKEILGMIKKGMNDDNEKTRKMFINAFYGDDFRKGVEAFLEGKKPNFS